MKVRYRTERGSESTAYLDDGEGDTRTGTDKYTDEPLTVRWDGSKWVEITEETTCASDATYATCPTCTTDTVTASAPATAPAANAG